MKLGLDLFSDYKASLPKPKELDNYMKKSDSIFHWELIKTFDTNECSFLVHYLWKLINMLIITKIKCQVNCLPSMYERQSFKLISFNIYNTHSED